MEPKSPFMIYADIESILVLENNGNQISDVFSIKKKIKIMLAAFLVIN